MAVGCLERDIHSLPQHEKTLSPAVSLDKERARSKHCPGGPWGATGLDFWEQESHTSLPGATMSGWIRGTLQGILHTGMHMA